jgi:hypothetical protein
MLLSSAKSFKIWKVIKMIMQIQLLALGCRPSANRGKAFKAIKVIIKSELSALGSRPAKSKSRQDIQDDHCNSVLGS